MSNVFYTTVIYPIYQIIEFVYSAFFLLSKNVGLSVIGVSVAVTLLCLPLYAVAEKWQEEERNKKVSMQSWVNHIKKSFSGDEQYMILSTFYRQNNYKPIMALRSSFGLLIQIPFFIAAYNFLSHNSALVNESFLFIKDMGSSDGLLKVGTISINLLPILMTLINILSGAVYTKGFTFKEKAQLYAMALLFLVVLYPSPSGLVLYWTMNNVFSLVKNIFYKLKNPLKVFWIFCCVLVFAMQAFLIKNIIAKFAQTSNLPKLRVALVSLLCVIYLIPLLIKATKKLSLLLEKLFYNTQEKNQNILFILTSLSIALLSCVVVSNAISTSVSEFSFIGSITNPNVIIKHTLFTSLGFCFLWPMCIYFLFSKKVKNFMAFFSVAILFVELCDVFFFTNDFGTMTCIFNVWNINSPFSKISIINLFIVILISLSILFCIKFWGIKFVTSLSFVACTVLIILCCYNTININKKFIKYTISRSMPDDINSSNKENINGIKPIYNFSKTGKNIVVMMIDRAQGSYVDLIFNEKPELKKSFDGFVFYNNTVSFGRKTIYGAPPIFGGYEYTPGKLKNRTDELITQHTEAISVLPTILYQNGFDVFFARPSDGTYIETINMEKHFKEEGKINALDRFQDLKVAYYKDNNISYQHGSSIDTILLRNTSYYSLLCKVPVCMRPAVFKDDYWNDDQFGVYGFQDFVAQYAQLYYLKDLTTYEAKNDSAMLIINLAAHVIYGLQAPDYKVMPQDLEDENAGYSPNMVCYLALANWFEELKKNDVYDNTRIIIVSDHGIDVPKNDPFDPILFVKDFNCRGELKIDSTFMTNADVPFLTCDQIIPKDKILNPFTGNLIQNKDPMQKKDDWDKNYRLK